MSDRPVFRDPFEAGLWRELAGLPQAADPAKVRTRLLAAVQSHGGPLASAVLTALIRQVAAAEADGWEDTVAKLVALRRPQDSGPVLAAAEAFIRKGRLDAAKPYVQTAGDGLNVPAACKAAAILLLADGDSAGALKNLRRARLSAPCDEDTYTLLAKADAAVDWNCLLACELLAAGGDPPAVKDGGTKEYALYRIYQEWYRGSREEATKHLIAAAGYQEKDPDYCLASARMSADERDWHSAGMMYDAACLAVPDDVRAACESGRACLAAGDAEAALVRYRRAEAYDPGSPTVMRGLADAYAALGRKGEASQVTLELLDSELAGYQDYLGGAGELMAEGFAQEAAAAVDALLLTYPGDAAASILRSRSELLKGNLRAALDQAEAAVKNNKDDAGCLAQRSAVYLAMGRGRKALRDAKKAVEADRTSIPALTALMCARQDAGDTDGTIAACRKVLELEPQNEIAQDLLSKAEFAQAGDRASYDALAKVAVTTGAESFIHIVSSLIAQKRYAEAERLCADNEARFGGLTVVRRLRGNAEYGNGEYLKASASYAAAAALEPDSAVLWYSKGMADEAFGDLDSAEEAYSEAVLLDMKEPRYWVSRACIQERQGNLRGAVESLNRAIELAPGSAYPLVRKAQILARYGRYAEALSFMDLAAATDPRARGIRQVRMDICLIAGRYTEAVELGRDLLRIDPGDDETASRAIWACLRLGNMQEARELTEQALDVHPNAPAVMAAARDFYEAAGESIKVIELCRRILDTAPEDRTTRQVLAEALSAAGKEDEAEALLAGLGDGTAVDEEPAPAVGGLQDPGALFDIAQSLESTGDLVGAGRMADRAMAADPGNVTYMLFRAELYRKTGDLRIAEAFLSQCLLRAPDSTALLEADGDLRRESGDLKGAAEAYGKAVELGLRAAPVYFKRGAVQEELGSLAAAVNSYSTAVMLNPHDAEACRRLALAQVRVKNMDGAVRTMETSLAGDPSAESCAVLAKVHQARRDRDGVKDAYARFLRCDRASDASLQMMATALGSVGLRSEAAFLRSRLSAGTAMPDEVPPVVKRTAETLLRRAYRQKLPVDDPDLLEELGLKDELSANVQAYLGDLPEYGEVVPGTNEFDRLEELSCNAVVRGDLAELGKEGITVQCAYVAGGAADADEAKLLTAYVRSALTARLPKEIPDAARAAAAKHSKDDRLTDIMRKDGVGVFRARMIKACAQ